MKSLYQKDTSKPMSIATLFTRAKIGNQPKRPTVDEQVKKGGSSTHWGQRKREILSFETT